MILKKSATPIFHKENSTGPALADGSRIGVIGAGPAGSFFSYFCLEMAKRAGLDIRLDLYEPKNFSSPAPHGCNMCGGVVSESLVQTLAAEGIHLPPAVVQRGIESYKLHMDVGSVRIESPMREKRIAAVHRGLGPRSIKDARWDSFDGYLQKLAIEKGATPIRDRVTEAGWSDGRPRLKTRDGSSATYDLLVVAAGINSPALKLFQGPGSPYRAPLAARTVIFEYYLGEEVVGEVIGHSMHVFLLDLPRIEFAAIIPKGEYVTVCMLGEDIDNKLVASFMDSPEVKACLPPELLSERSSCICKPRINVRGALRPFGDRILFIGDCGVTRLYKDGIGAAYRTGKAAATAAVFQGISAESFERHFWPVCRSISRDNFYGRLTFAFTRLLRKWRFSRRVLLAMIAREQMDPHRSQNLSRALWDVFTGSAPYREILIRMTHPLVLMRLVRDLAVSVLPLRSEGKRERRRTAAGNIGKAYRDGEIIIRQGDMGDCLYVIQEGRAEILLERDGRETRLRVADTGEILGETAVFARVERSATVRALGEARVLSVDKRNFLRRIQEDPTLAFRLVEIMSRRVRVLSDEVARLKKQNATGGRSEDAAGETDAGDNLC